MICNRVQFGQIGLCDRKAGHPDRSAAQIIQELFTGDSIMKCIPLTQGKFALVDDADYSWLNQWKWYAHKDCHTYYAQRHDKGKTVSMHRVILDVPSGVLSDHRNHNGLDNQRHNIRRCTNAENQYNQLPTGTGTSKYKGVHWNRGRWQASIKYKGKQLNFSRHKSEVEAARAYNKKAKELFGEFASINAIGDNKQ